MARKKAPEAQIVAEAVSQGAAALPHGGRQMRMGTKRTASVMSERRVLSDLSEVLPATPTPTA